MTTIRTAALAAGLTIVSVGALAADLPQRPAPAPAMACHRDGGDCGRGVRPGARTHEFATSRLP